MIDPDLVAALNRDKVVPLFLVEIVWKEGVTRVHSALGEINSHRLLTGDYSNREVSSSNGSPTYSSVIVKAGEMTVGRSYLITANIVSTNGDRESGWSSRNGIPGGNGFRKTGTGSVGGVFKCTSNSSDLLLFTYNQNTEFEQISVKEVGLDIPAPATFLGIGSIGKVSVLKQQSGESPSRLNLTLSSFDDSVRGEALSAVM